MGRKAETKETLGDISDPSLVNLLVRSQSAASSFSHASSPYSLLSIAANLSCIQHLCEDPGARFPTTDPTGRRPKAHYLSVDLHLIQTTEYVALENCFFKAMLRQIMDRSTPLITFPASESQVSDAFPPDCCVADLA